MTSAVNDIAQAGHESGTLRLVADNTQAGGELANADNHRTIYLVKQLERAVRVHLEEITRTLGLTAMQYTVLSVLEGKPGIASAQLARRSFVSPQAGHEMVVALERKGFVIRRMDSSNRRIVKLHLSEEGQKVLEQCHAQVDALENHMLLELQEPERSQLRNFLETGIKALRRS